MKINQAKISMYPVDKNLLMIKFAKQKVQLGIIGKDIYLGVNDEWFVLTDAQRKMLTEWANINLKEQG